MDIHVVVKGADWCWRCRGWRREGVVPSTRKHGKWVGGGGGGEDFSGEGELVRDKFGGEGVRGVDDRILCKFGGGSEYKVVHD